MYVYSAILASQGCSDTCFGGLRRAKYFSASYIRCCSGAIGCPGSLMLSTFVTVEHEVLTLTLDRGRPCEVLKRHGRDGIHVRPRRRVNRRNDVA